MKKLLNKIIICISFLVISLGSTVFADSFSSMHQDIFIEKNGDVLVNETIKATADMGTEWYIGFNDSNYEFIGITENGNEMTKTTWNPNWSISEKKGKYGFLNGELCWGKGQLNVPKVYVLTYRIKDLLKNADGHGIFNHQFIGNQGGLKYSATIHADNPINDNNANIWGFGYIGNIYFADENKQLNTGNDSLIIIPELRLGSSDKIIIMLELVDNSVVNIENLSKSNRDLEEIKNTALKGAVFEDFSSNNKQFPFIIILGAIIIIIHVGICLAGIIFSKRKLTSFIGLTFGSFHGGGFLLVGLTTFGSTGLIFLMIGLIELFLFDYGTITSIKRAKEWKEFLNEGIEYYRDCPDNLESTYSIVNANEDILKVNRANYIGAVIMDFVKNGNLEAINDKDLQLVKEPNSNNVIQYKLWNIIKKAAGKDGILQSGEFTKYAKTYYDSIHSFLNSIEANGKQYLSSKGYLIHSRLSYPNDYTETGKIELKKICGLQKYFKDFTLLNEREIYEVHNWENMLVYATLLNVAETVMKRLSIVIPEQYKQLQSYGYNYNTVRLANDLGRSFTSTAASAYSRAHSSSSSGGGGSSSHSGGGGHSGGGHGGGGGR